MTPQPVPKPLIPHPEDWEAWCEHPVTQFVATAYRNAAEAQKDVWMQLSWGAGQCDPVKLIEWRARADAYAAFLETPLEDHIRHVEA